MKLISLQFKKAGALLKAPKNYLCGSIRFWDDGTTEVLKAMHEAVKTSGFPLYGEKGTSYIHSMRMGMKTYIDDLTVIKEHGLNDQVAVLTIANEKVKVACGAGAGTPWETLDMIPIINEAVIVTWPNENGICKIYAHLGANAVRSLRTGKMDKSIKDDPDVERGVRLEALTGRTDWTLLSRYILSRHTWYQRVDRNVICAMVKELTKAHLSQETAAELSVLGMDGDMGDF